MTRHNKDGKTRIRGARHRTAHPVPPTNLGGHILGETYAKREMMLAQMAAAAQGDQHHPLRIHPWKRKK